MLWERCQSVDLQGVLRPPEDLSPYPPASARSFWSALPSGVRELLIARGEGRLAEPWPRLSLGGWLEYTRSGDRAGFEAKHFLRRAILRDLVLAECVEGGGRFTERIAEAVWSICEETFWGIPACLYLQAEGEGLPDVEEPVVDLFAAETAALLAWTHFLLDSALDAVSPLLCRRIRWETQRRVLGPCRERDDFWWMGLRTAFVNNWNPWIHANWLAAALFLERDRERRVAAVRKIASGLDRFIGSRPADGGCDEGPNYWGHAAGSLFEALELLDWATGGNVRVYDEPLIRRMGRYLVDAHIADNWFINFADASAVVQPDGFLARAYGRAAGDADLEALGDWFARDWTPPPDNQPNVMGRCLRGVCAGGAADGGGAQPLPARTDLPDTGVYAARGRAGTAAGFFVAAKGGHNDESHNHNDVGQFIIFRDGRPLLIDVGVETYRRATFGPDRYSIWTMRSEYHNLPTINGVAQSPGAAFRAREAEARTTEDGWLFRAELAGAYPEEAGVRSWKREIALAPEDGVRLRDSFELERAESVVLSLLTAGPVEAEEGVLWIAARDLPDGRSSAPGLVRFEKGDFAVAAETVRFADARLGKVWGDRVYRTRLELRTPGKTGGYGLWIGRS